MNYGTVREGQPIGYRGGRRKPVLTEVDTTGFFEIKLKTQSARICVDCMLGGEVCEEVRHSDSIVIYHIKVDCNEYNEVKAESDIAQGKITLLCSLGYFTYKFDSIDIAFEKKYGLSYYSFGDQPIYYDCSWLYNRFVAKFLDKKYGDLWRKEVRWDVPLY